MKVHKSEEAKKQIYKTYDQLLTMWNTDYDEMDIPTYAGDTHVIKCGKEENPPLVLFHGVGESDPFAKLGGKESLLRHKMNAQFFSDVGHGINHEISDKVNKAIIEYFAS